jgi:hypothetical protein
MRQLMHDDAGESDQGDDKTRNEEHTV